MQSTDYFPEFQPEPTHLERQMVRDLLKVHGTNPGLLVFFRLHAAWLVFRYLPVIPFVLITYHYGKDKSAISLLLILVAWCLYFDVKMIRHYASSWPLYERVLDWDRVRKLAEAKS